LEGSIRELRSYAIGTDGERDGREHGWYRSIF